ncbi:TPA_asm: capsid protein precursor [Patiria miniata associated picornavirus 1]|nr:TPA_asm: capsid protein precursor [Patiria miniata associated picornavirus 1]
MPVIYLELSICKYVTYKPFNLATTLPQPNYSVDSGTQPSDTTPTINSSETSVTGLATTTTDNMMTDSSHVVKFSDTGPVNAVYHPSHVDESRYFTSFEDQNLASFFARPVKTGEYEWNVDSALTLSFNPWKQFFSDPFVKRKLDNYQFLTAKLHVKIVLNGSQFHYGLLNLSYLPCHGLLPSHDMASWPTTTDIRGVKATHFQNVNVDPNSTTAACLCLPFIWPEDMIKISTLTSEFNHLGKCYVNTFALLRAATPSASDAINVSVYVHASDVHLAGVSYQTFSGLKPVSKTPTYLPGTSQQEYEDDGIISKPLSLIAKATEPLAQIPMLSKVASATGVVARGLASMAYQFGFSRPLTVAPIRYMKRYPFSALAHTEGEDTATKLSLDPKSAVTVDPSINAGGDYDPMDISRFTQHENFFHGLPWFNTAEVDALIWQANVHPGLGSSYLNGASGSSEVMMTALHYASLPFEYWSGSINLRIKIVASSYHRGRLKLSYDPSGAPDVTATNVQQSIIIDLADSTEITMTIPWSQPVAYKPVGGFRDPLYADGAAAIRDTVNNGVLSLSVVNRVVSSDNSQPVVILFYISGGEDFQLMAPSRTSDNTGNSVPTLSPYPYVAASGLIPDTETDKRYLFGSSRTKDQVNLMRSIYCGEAIISFRELLKRYTWADSITQLVFGTGSAGSYFNSHMNFPYWIVPWGFRTTDTTETPIQVNTGVLNGQPYTPGATSLLSYLAFSFVGMRGGMRYKYLQDHKNFDPKATFVSRSVMANSTLANNGLFEGYTPNQTSNYFREKMCGVSGALLTLNEQQAAVEIELPYYSSWRFIPSDPQNLCSSTYNPNGMTPGRPMQSEIIMQGHNPRDIVTSNDSIASVTRYAAIGEDFQFVEYIGPPRLYDYGTNV